MTVTQQMWGSDRKHSGPDTQDPGPDRQPPGPDTQPPGPYLYFEYLSKQHKCPP